MGFFDFFGLGDLLTAGVDVANNERNIAMQRETNQLNAQLAREQMQQQMQMQRENNAFNSAEAIKAFQREAQYNNESAVVARRISAGLNPVEGGNGISGVSAPAASAAHSGISPTMTHLDAPHSEFNLMSEFSSLAAGLKSAAEAKKVGVDTSYLEKTLNTRIKTAEALQEGEEWKAALAGVHANVEALYSRGIKEKELELLTKNIANAEQDFWLKDAQIAVSNAQEILNRAQAHKYGKDSELIEMDIENYINNMNSLIALRKAHAEQSRASAAESRARAETENTMRPLIKYHQKLINKLQGMKNFVKSETMGAEIDGLIEQYHNAGYSNEYLEQKIKTAVNDNNWYDARLYLDMFEGLSKKGK